MVILGIDPGSRKTGYALIKVSGTKLQYLHSGVLRYDHIKEFMSRLGEIYREAEGLVQDYSPDEIALESLIFVKSPTSLMKLAQSRGAIVAAFQKTHQGHIYEYSPNLVKAIATGHGHATKESVQKVLNLLFGTRVYKTDDESDALAIAVCHALHGKKGKVAQAPRMGKSLSQSVIHRVKESS